MAPSTPAMFWGFRARVRGYAGLAGLLAWACCACSGSIDDPNVLNGPGGPYTNPFAGSAAHGGAGGTGSLLPAAGNGSLPPGQTCRPGAPVATTRLARLTHHQYDNTVRDLTGLSLGLAAEFLADPHQAGFDRGLDLQVGDVLAKAYRDASEKVADSVVNDSAAYARVVGCNPTQGDTCAKTFIAEFGKKTWRRPLTDAEQASLLTLFKMGPTLADTGDDFQKGVRVTLEALLQSPKFLYRIELSNTPAGNQIKLNGYEVASRLSFMLGNTSPDATLMTAAANNQLGTPEQVAMQATRLLQGQGAHETVRDFHHQWLDLDIFPNKLTKDSKLYPTVTPDLAPALQSEVEKFVDAVTFDRKAGYASLLTAPFTFVNKTTAALYGVTGNFNDTLQSVNLNPAQRAGLLTQVGFLATHAFSGLSSPIHRGVFIQRRLLCNQIKDPPANVPSLPPLDGTNIKTTRQQVDTHTANEPCASCHHTLINPVGFGLENYDAVGSFRTTENGEPIDATGRLVGTAEGEPFMNGVELSQTIAAAPEAQLCYVKNWFRYTLGRQETDADSCDLANIAGKLANDKYTALDVLTDLTRTQAFSVRAVEAP